MKELCSLWLVLCTANFDTLLLSLSWGLQGRRIHVWHTLWMALLTSAVTWAALGIGAASVGLFALTDAAAVGCGLLIAFGLWTLLDWLRTFGAPETTQPQPETVWGYGFLSLALAANNCGLGLAAGLSGASPALAAAINCALTLILLPLGCHLGHRLCRCCFARWTAPLSGLLLMALGVWLYL